MHKLAAFEFVLCGDHAGCDFVARMNSGLERISLTHDHRSAGSLNPSRVGHDRAVQARSLAAGLRRSASS